MSARRARELERNSDDAQSLDIYAWPLHLMLIVPAVTLIDLSDQAHPVQASFRGEERIYPASVVKLFYLAAAHRWLEDGKIQETDELRRALRDMIVDSSNDATQFVVDVLT